jgi:hypothetical protein
MTKPVLEIDGARFDDFEGFCREVSERVFPGAEWRGNLDALHDYLHCASYGDFGTPEGGFILRWANSARSRETLGYSQMIGWLQSKREHCHPSFIESVEAELVAARGGEGQTLFDLLVETIEDRGCSEDTGIELQLA